MSPLWGSFLTPSPSSVSGERSDTQSRDTITLRISNRGGVSPSGNPYLQICKYSASFASSLLGKTCLSNFEHLVLDSVWFWAKERMKFSQLDRLNTRIGYRTQLAIRFSDGCKVNTRSEGWLSPPACSCWQKRHLFPSAFDAITSWNNINLREQLPAGRNALRECWTGKNECDVMWAPREKAPAESEEALRKKTNLETSSSELMRA